MHGIVCIKQASNFAQIRVRVVANDSMCHREADHYQRLRSVRAASSAGAKRRVRRRDNRAHRWPPSPTQGTDLRRRLHRAVIDCVFARTAHWRAVMRWRPQSARLGGRMVRLVSLSLTSRRSTATPQRSNSALRSGPACCSSLASLYPPLRRSSTPFVPDCESANVNLAYADVVVAEGLGLRSAKKFQMVRQFAAFLRAEYGCSGPLAQKAWITSARQIGHAGKIIRPKLFIAAGFSGAILHRVDVKGADLIVAISIEKNAPIFELAHVGSDANRLLGAPMMAAFARVCGRIRAFRSRARGSCRDRGKVRRHRGRRRDSRHAWLPMAKLDMKAFRPKRGEYSPAPSAAARSVATGFRRGSCISKRLKPCALIVDTNYGD